MPEAVGVDDDVEVRPKPPAFAGRVAAVVVVHDVPTHVDQRVRSPLRRRVVLTVAVPG